MTEHARTAECGYCEGHGYTIQSGKVVACDDCRPSVTWEMVYRFRAADDAQADRLAHAWAGTINAEFGCDLVSLRKVES